MNSGVAVQRIIRPIPSAITEYTKRMEVAQSSALGAGLCGDYEACERYKKELRQLAAELASWCGCEGDLRDCKIGMGKIKLDGLPLE